MTLKSESEPGEHPSVMWLLKAGLLPGIFFFPSVLGEWFLFGHHARIYAKESLRDDKENCVEPVGVASFEDSHSWWTAVTFSAIVFLTFIIKAV